MVKVIALVIDMFTIVVIGIGKGIVMEIIKVVAISKATPKAKAERTME